MSAASKPPSYSPNSASECPSPRRAKRKPDDQPLAPFTGRIIVRLAPDAVARLVELARVDALPEPANLERIASELKLPGLARLLRRYPDLPSFPAAADFKLARVVELEDRARESDFPPLRSLVGYFVLDPRNAGNVPDTDRLLTELNALPKTEVDVAYPEPELEEPGTWAVVPDEPYAINEEYLKDAPGGINAWTDPVWGHYDGAGIGFADLETGWNVTHQDLPTAQHPVYHINQRTASNPAAGDHGTAVLGVVLGKDDTTGIVGVAPKATLVRLVSRVRSASDKWDVVGAILAALDVLAERDVLLIEVQTVGSVPGGKGYPVEVVDHWFDAVRLAAGNGIVVVEAAGNGTYDSRGNEVGHNLDQWTGNWLDVPTGRLKRRTLKPGDPDFLDSGAVMVSACVANVSPAGAHRRARFANHGGRINCYAWGEEVFTAGYGDFGPDSRENRLYTDTFGGTSAASAIITGAALLVQQMHEALRGARATPLVLRALLSDWANGTPIMRRSDATQIGVMPDLEKIAARLHLKE